MCCGVDRYGRQRRYGGHSGSRFVRPRKQGVQLERENVEKFVYLPGAEPPDGLFPGFCCLFVQPEEFERV